MSSLLHWFSPNAMHALGWALLHFLWQGMALAALAAAAMAFCRRTSARYLVGITTLGLMLIAPVATFLFYSQQHSVIADTANSSPLPAVAWPIAKHTPTHVSSAATSLDAIPWLVQSWLLGVAFFSLRTAGGFFLLERARRRQSSVVSAHVLQICYTLQDRLGLGRAIQYCECKWLQAPAVIGWFRPIVFLPASALTGLSEDQLQAVIAHELAHIRRFDAFVNVFQVCVETLLFYHPAVWWLNRRIRAEREHCCDETAVSVCGNAVEYARALTLMEEWRSAPRLVMAANRGPLTERIVRVLGLKTLSIGIRSIGLTGSLLCLTAALAAGNALLGMAHPRLARAGSILQATPKPETPQQPSAKPATTAKPSPAQSQSPVANTNPAPSSSSYIDAMKAAGLANPTIDELVALKIQGVTPEYVRQMHDLGLHPDADGLVGLKVQGVTPEYVKELRAMGFNPDQDQIIGMKVQGVTADYVKGLKEVGIQGDADDIVGLKVQGVTPEYVRDLRAAGLKVDSGDVVGLKVQGVTPAYVQGLKAQGIEVNSDDVVGMKVQGVTPEYIRDIRALGFHPSADEIVGMKVQGVTPEFIKALQAAGFKPSIDDIVGAKVQGVTPEFIDEARKHGFQNLTIEKLIELKRLGILDSKAEL
jgi:beta-lactamase regulating signal transducer with metallopeptidase domain